MYSTEAAVFSSSESAAAPDSPFVGYVNLPQGFSGLGAPSHVFTSPLTNSHHQTQFLSVEISPSENETRIFIDGAKNSTSLLRGMFITDNQKDFDGKNDAHNQNCDVLFSQCVANVLQSGYDFTRQSLPPLQDLQEREYCRQMEQGLLVRAENMMQDDHEAGLQHLGMQGPLLQFEDATLNALASSNSSPLTALITDQSQENNALLAVGSVPSEFPKPSNMLNFVDLPASVYDWRKSSSTDANQSSTRKRRAKTPKDGDDDRRCNCRKTRCLKLYCECFSSQYFCDESTCSCQDCGNTPENEEEVTDVKEEIGSRKPLAFAPKIVECGTNVPWNNINMEGVSLKIPSSTRHRRGCNCLKSKCQKKYCQCYEANVGCTNACRCQECENIHGSKGEYRKMEDAVIMERFRNMVENTSDTRFQNKPEMVANMTNLLHSGSSGLDQPSLPTPPLPHTGTYGLDQLSLLTPPLPHSGSSGLDQPSLLTPPTPFQCSYQGTEAANSHIVSGNQLLASPFQLTNEVVAYNWQLDYNNLNILNQSSLNNACQPTPPPPHFDSQASLLTNHPQSQLSHGNIPLILEFTNDYIR